MHTTLLVYHPIMLTDLWYCPSTPPIFTTIPSYHYCTTQRKPQQRSRAIARYLATKAQASQLIPVASDADYLQKLAKFEVAASIEYSNFDPLASRIAKEAIFKPMFVSLSDLTIYK